MSDTASPTTGQWWGSHRLHYNLALIIAGIVAFIGYVMVLAWIGANVRGPDGEEPVIEVTLFTTLFQGCGYLVMVGIANLFYYLGPISERFFAPRNVDRYRRITFHLGLWFSVALAFLIPVSLILTAIFHPEHFLGREGDWVPTD